MQIVKDLMVPLEDYTRVADTASLYDAAKALEKALTDPSDPTRPKDRAVLVQAPDGRVLGKLTMADVLHGLEPRYGRAIGSTLVVVDDYFTWTHAMFANLADRARAIPVKELLREHSSEEMIEESASLDQAVHQLVHGKLQSLLVTRGGRIVGILRLSDVFTAVSTLLDTAKAQLASA